MLRKRDLSAPSDLTEAHKRAICQNPGILQLRREKRGLMAEMRSVAGTIKSARDTFPHLFQRHETVKKDLAKLRKTLAIETRETARKDYFNNAPVLEFDRQIKQMLIGESDVEERDADSSAEEDWELPIRTTYFLNELGLWRTFTVLTQKTFMRTNYLLDASRLPRTWLRFYCFASRAGEATVLIGISMKRKTYLLNSPSNWRLMMIHKYVQQMFASSALVNLVSRRRTLPRINFLPSDRTHFVVISSTLICFMHTTGSAATGKHVALFPSLPKTPNF